MKDTRELKTFERTLGNYDIAGAIYSYGDAIAFADIGNKGWVVIADTVGHIKEHGDKMEEFLHQEIAKGWGSGLDTKEEVADLGRRLLIAGTGKPEFPDGIHCDWWDSPEFCYARLLDSEIHLSGLHFNLVRKNGKFEEIPYETPERIKMMSPLHFDDQENRSPYHISFKTGDVLLMASDGLKDNISYTLRLRGEEMNREKAKLKLIEVITQYKSEKPMQIRDALVTELKDYFLPGAMKNYDPILYEYDDVTFAVIKKT
ncbi:MAG: SpoIIE family protein phosphatase [Candidatus Heimdallarchaeota archaeon]|nr:SpoIIE family protein phosphatase [Candidatus Heimdallarchaeota archaeon]